MSVSVYGTKQVKDLATNLEENLIDMPLVAPILLSLADRASQGGTELAAPVTNGLIADRDAPLRQQVLYVTIAECETVIELDGMSDDLRRKAVALVEGSRCGQTPSMGHTPLSPNPLD